MSSNRRRGGLVGMITAGVGVAAEYREHRKEQKQRQLSRETTGQDEQTSQAGPSTSTQPRDLNAPPSYADLPEGSGNRLLASGGPANDDKKTAHAQYQDDDDEDSDDSPSTEDDEEDWQLDEVLPSYEESAPDYRSADELARDVMLTSKAASDVPRIRHALPLPVIIPQRRPRNKTRGFVRAYAPVLADSDIDQATFLSFLDNLYKSSQASPVFTVIFISATIAGFAPSLIAMAVTTAVQVAAHVGAEVQGRQRTNHFLDKMNDELFKPKGLYAFVMKYKTDEELNNQINSFSIRGEKVDMSTNQIIAKYAPATLAIPEEQRSFRSRLADPGHAMYQGQIGLVGLATGGGSWGRMDHGRGLSRRKMGRYEHFLSEQDRLSGAGGGRMGDADGLGHSRGGRRRGGLIHGLIGAAVNAAQDRGGNASSASGPQGAREPVGSRMYEDAYDNRKTQEDQYYDDPPRHFSYDGREDDASGAVAGGYQKFTRRGQRGGGRRPGAVGAVRRLMREDVLYLMIVNMPSEEEMAEARREMGER
ncbi:hypothetical protein LTR87_005120 [Friedmanniomyces endolithicus]|nr:hypothetical protein LTR87_005120 [Friedmanniomyces endolithicus]